MTQPVIINGLNPVEFKDENRPQSGAPLQVCQKNHRSETPVTHICCWHSCKKLPPSAYQQSDAAEKDAPASCAAVPDIPHGFPANPAVASSGLEVPVRCRHPHNKTVRETVLRAGCDARQDELRPAINCSMVVTPSASSARVRCV